MPTLVPRPSCLDQMPKAWPQALKENFCAFTTQKPSFPFEEKSTMSMGQPVENIFWVNRADEGNYMKLCHATEYVETQADGKRVFKFRIRDYHPHTAEIWKESKDPTHPRDISDGKNVVGVDFVEAVPNGDEDGDFEAQKMQNYYLVVQRKSLPECSPPINGNQTTVHGKALQKIYDSHNSFDRSTCHFLKMKDGYKNQAEEVAIITLHGNAESHKPNGDDSLPQNQCEWVPHSKIIYEGGKLIFDLDDFNASEYTFSVVAGHSKSQPILQFNVSKPELQSGATLVFGHNAANPADVLEGTEAVQTPSLFKIGVKLYGAGGSPVPTEQWGLPLEEASKREAEKAAERLQKLQKK